MIECGDRVRDPITKYEGVVVAITDWLFGCRRPLVQAEGLTDDGKPKGSESFDEDQLELLDKAVVRRPAPRVNMTSVTSRTLGVGYGTQTGDPDPEPVPARTGGPGANPSQHASPSRG